MFIDLGRIELPDCTFSHCFIRGDGPTSTFGGAVSLYGLSSLIVMSDCCGGDCFATNAESFLVDYSVDSGQVMNLSSFLSCGSRDASDSIKDAHIYGYNIPLSLLSVNFTNCSALHSSAILAVDLNSSLQAMFLNVFDCSGRSVIDSEGTAMSVVNFSNFSSNTITDVSCGAESSLIDQYHGPLIPSVEQCTFFNNNISGDGGVLYGRGCVMNVS
jgi:hypothetical protein